MMVSALSQGRCILSAPFPPSYDTLLGVIVPHHLMEKLYGAKPQEEKPKDETSVEKEREKLKGNLKEEVCASNVCAYRGKNICTIKRDEFCPMFKYKEE